MSRTPIREALQDLSAEGLVEFSPYKGASVAPLSFTELEEIYAVRTALEGYAGYLAAQRITAEELQELETLLTDMEQRVARGDLAGLTELNVEFNSIIYAASRQNLLFEQALKFMELANLYRRMHFSVDRLAADAIAEHRVLLAALREHDSKKVEQLTRQEANRSVDALRIFFEGEGSP